MFLPWNKYNELFALAKQVLFTALVGDVMDKMGFFDQFLPQNLKHPDPKMVVIGRAMPVWEQDLPEITCYKHPDDYQGPTIFINFNPKMTGESYVETFPYLITREVILKNVTTASGKPLRLSDDMFMFQCLCNDNNIVSKNNKIIVALYLYNNLILLNSFY